MDDWTPGLPHWFAESVRRESREDWQENACRFPPYPEGPWDGMLTEDDWLEPGDWAVREPRMIGVCCIGRHHAIYGSRRRSGWEVYLKRRKARSERRRARQNPEATPAYNRYWGWWW